MKSQTKVSAIFLLLTLSVTGCDLIPRNVGMDDPRIQPLLKAAAKFDRTAYGFTPIPNAADVRWESKPTRTYDAMLHISTKTSRTIAFRRAGSGYRWIGEQEDFEGPRMYKTVDGTFHEAFTFTYDAESVSGFPTNQLNITYRGEDSRFLWPKHLTLTDVRPTLRKWGY